MLVVCPLVLTVACSAQTSDIALESTRVRLAILQRCVGSANDDLRELSQGLLVGWDYGGSAGKNYAGSPPPPSNAYLDSIDRDTKACLFASKIKDKERKQMILQAVSDDIAIKARDCRKFGMGRMISVRVFTLGGANAEDGWEVFYKWNCSSDFQPGEMRASRLTSPAVVQLPPGTYTIRAQKKISDTQILSAGPSRTVVGLEPSIDIQLSIQ